MKRQQWDITVNETKYSIVLTRNAIIVNGVRHSMFACRINLLTNEYRVPIEGADVILVWQIPADLVVNGRYVSSGHPYSRPKAQSFYMLYFFMPVYGFMIIYLDFMSACKLLVLGMVVTQSICMCKIRYSIVKFGLNILVLIATIAIIEYQSDYQILMYLAEDGMDILFCSLLWYVCIIFNISHCYYPYIPLNKRITIFLLVWLICIGIALMNCFYPLEFI